MVYSGLAANPYALLPNFTWYSSMLLGLLLGERFFKVRCCDRRGAEPHGCTVAVGCLVDEQTREADEAAGEPAGYGDSTWWRLPPIRGLWGSTDLMLASWCDYAGTVATAMGLTLAG